MRYLKLFAVSLAMAGLATAARAQMGMQHHGGNYDPSTEATLTGTIGEVSNMNMPSGGRGMGGVHFVLNAASGPIDVHVGPSWFVASKNITFAQGDSVTVVGSSVTLGGHTFLIAREIHKGDQVLTLRDAKGVPLWSGRGRGY